MSIGRFASTGIALCCAAVAAAAAALPADAAYTLTGAFGGAATTPVNPEPLSSPRDLAVNEATGDIYVIDGGHNRVERFDAAGNYLGQFNGSAAPSGPLEVLSHIAVDSSTSPADPSAGDVYVTDARQKVMDKFTASGEYISQVKFEHEHRFEFDEPEPEGVAVDASGNLWLSLRLSGVRNEVREYSDAASNVETVHWSPENERPSGSIAVDGGDNVYPGAGQFKFASEGAFEGEVTSGAEAEDTVDLVTDRLYLIDRGEVQIYDTSGMSNEKSKGSLLEAFGKGEVVASGIAVNGLAGEAYVADSSHNDVAVFSFPVLAGLAIGAPSNLGGTSMTLNATVDPIGRDAHTIEFEYGTTAAYGSTAPTSPSDAGSGTAPVPVSATLTGLIPNTLYHYRLRATNENGTSTTADHLFVTPPAPATVNDQAPYASEVSQFAATLNGTINPGNGVTSYRFVYGPTSAYGSSIPVPEALAPLNYADDAVTERVTGLQAGTTYHYALVATNVGGTVVGPDQTFTTLPIPPPSVATAAASAVTRGEALVSGTIDPHGRETSYRFEYGTTTAYGSSWPTIDVSLGALSGVQPVSVTVSNLQPGTTYHYRLVATNGGGTSYGPDMSFTTAEYPASVVQPTPLVAPIGFYNPEASMSKPAHARGHAKHKSARKRRKRPRKRRKG